MRKNEALRRLRPSVMILVTALLLSAGVGGGMAPSTQARSVGDPGVSAHEISIGASLPESGPAGAYGAVAGGIQAYFKYVNARGGVAGRKLTLRVYDDGYEPARTLANVKRLVQVNKVFALLSVLGTDNNLAALPFITQQGVPLVFPATGSSRLAQPTHKYVFPLQASYSLEGKALADYATKTLRAKRLAVFYQNDDFGKEGLAAVTQRAAKNGATVVASASYELSDNDLSAQVLTLQRSGADAVIIFAVPQPAATFIGTAAKVGFKAPMLSSSIAADTAVLGLLGPAGEGVYFGAWLPLPTSKDPQAVLYRSVIGKYGDPVTAPFGEFTEVGMAGAQVLVEGLRRAGPNPTREGLIKALETVRAWNGSLVPKLTYTPTDHTGARGIYIARAHAGNFQAITSFMYP